jgi:hypothetical protein
MYKASNVTVICFSLEATPKSMFPYGKDYAPRHDSKVKALSIFGFNIFSM